MERLPPCNPLGKRPSKTVKARFGKLTLVEYPLIITVGGLIFAHFWFVSYLSGDEFSEKSKGLKYIPIKSEIERMIRGFNNIKKRFKKTDVEVDK